MLYNGISPVAQYYCQFWQKTEQTHAGVPSASSAPDVDALALAASLHVRCCLRGGAEVVWPPILARMCELGPHHCPPAVERKV